MFSFFNRNSVKSVHISEINSLLPNIKLIDIREPYETSMGTVKGAIKIPMNTLLSNPEKYLKKDEEYYIMCQSGMRSMRACKTLSALGYNAINVSGGYGGYR